MLHLTFAQLEKLQEEFVDYQLLEKHDVANVAWEKVMVFEEGGRRRGETIRDWI